MLPAQRLDKLNYAFFALETLTSGAISQRREASLQLNSVVLFEVPIQELIRPRFFFFREIPEPSSQRQKSVTQIGKSKRQSPSKRKHNQVCLHSKV
ncbi:hypothetical protein CDAR_382001 [Caerostris darwini]|uniref:Uncharacterized protein n=1 Tax=Caerostris darwini TaxID=1538125 RepID=A0AAV4V6W8_9ARAC|nr:hypothetical protein CDAR_382001 [Caerostris darwini]